MSSALSLAMTGLSSKVISGGQGALGFLDLEGVAEDDLGLLDLVDSDGSVSADLFAGTEAVFSLGASLDIGKISLESILGTFAFG